MSTEKIGTSNGEETSSAQTGKLVQLVAETLYALAERPEGASIRSIAQETGNSRSSARELGTKSGPASSRCFRLRDR